MKSILILVFLYRDVAYLTNTPVGFAFYRLGLDREIVVLIYDKCVCMIIHLNN